MLFATIAKYRLKHNREKCVFGVEAGTFLGFLLTERGIEANPDKCVTILAMRSPASVKELQQLTGRMASLSRFVSAGGDKGHPYFHQGTSIRRLLGKALARKHTARGGGGLPIGALGG